MSPILELRAVSKRFGRPRSLFERVLPFPKARAEADGMVRAVDQVDLRIEPGEVVGLVGESGCGKSTLGRIAAGLSAPTDGQRLWKGGKDGIGASGRADRLAVQMIFQDPYASLNPRLRVLDIVGEAPVVHGLIPSGQKREYVAEVLERVGLDRAALSRHPHQFSGGQRARIGIARALAVNPEFLVCDEAVAALDVSIQAQILNLFMRLREDLNLTYLFISHDLGIVRHLSDQVLVMYLGRIVEAAPAATLFAAPNHPYSQALLAETPTLDARKRRFIPIRGELPSPLAPPAGCHFHPRCPMAGKVPGDRCRRERPALVEIAPGHSSACHLNDM